ncbi:MAG: MCE family protein [Prevotella sp.]|nr:MCE family protein [Prevotella sp.]
MKISKEIKIALVAILGLVLLFFGMNYLKGLNLFSSDTSYFMSFKNINGLSNNSPVYADGYKVGVVKAINYDYNHQDDILIEVGVEPSLRIPKGSTAEVVSDLLGNVQVNLLLANNPRERLNPGECIEGLVNDGAMGKLKDMIPAVERILPKLDSIMSSLNTILANPAINQSIGHIEQVTGSVTTTTAQLNALIAGLNKEVPGMMSRANSVLDNTTQLTNNLAQVNVDETIQKVNATLDNVQKLTSQLNNTEGTVGLLMKDPTLYNNMNSTMRNADSLLIDLRNHPKRYVNFSVFGKKDK